MQSYWAMPWGTGDEGRESEEQPDKSACTIRSWKEMTEVRGVENFGSCMSSMECINMYLLSLLALGRIVRDPCYWDVLAKRCSVYRSQAMIFWVLHGHEQGPLDVPIPCNPVPKSLFLYLYLRGSEINGGIHIGILGWDYEV
jgi:hypothetical protein